jgi:hypothetical protein
MRPHAAAARFQKAKDATGAHLKTCASGSGSEKSIARVRSGNLGLAAVAPPQPILRDSVSERALWHSRVCCYSAASATSAKLSERARCGNLALPAKALPTSVWRNSVGERAPSRSRACCPEATQTTLAKFCVRARAAAISYFLPKRRYATLSKRCGRARVAALSLSLPRSHPSHSGETLCARARCRDLALAAQKPPEPVWRNSAGELGLSRSRSCCPEAAQATLAQLCGRERATEISLLLPKHRLRHSGATLRASARCRDLALAAQKLPSHSGATLQRGALLKFRTSCRSAAYATLAKLCR